MKSGRQWQFSDRPVLRMLFLLPKVDCNLAIGDVFVWEIFGLV